MSGGGYRDDDDDFDEGRRDRDRGPRRGGRREFPGDTPDFGAPPLDVGGGFGGDRDSGNRGGGDRDGGYRGGGDRDGGHRSGGYRGGGGDRDSGGHRGAGRDGGFRGGGGGRPNQEREPRELGPRQNGVLKFFNTDRGFGFITPEDGSKDVFVHISAIERSGLPALDEGTKVSFETEQDRRGRGPQAVNLQMIDD